MLQKVLIKVFALLLSAGYIYLAIELMSTDFISSIIPSWNTTLYSPEWMLIMGVLAIIALAVIIEKLIYAVVAYLKKRKLRKGFKA